MAIIPDGRLRVKITPPLFFSSIVIACVNGYILLQVLKGEIQFLEILYVYFFEMLVICMVQLIQIFLNQEPVRNPRIPRFISKIILMIVFSVAYLTPMMIQLQIIIGMFFRWQDFSNEQFTKIGDLFKLFMISNIIAILTNYIGQKEYLQPLTSTILMSFKRLIVMQITVLGGVYFVQALHQPRGVVVLFVLAKTAADILINIYTHSQGKET